MISSADGGTEIEGQSGGLGNRNDHTVFAALRAESDAVLVGMHTVVADHYGPPSVPRPADLRDQRQAPDVSGNEKLFASGRATLVLPETPARAGRRARAASEPGPMESTSPAVATQLAGSVVLMEGGPPPRRRDDGPRIDRQVLPHRPRRWSSPASRHHATHGPPADPMPWGLMHGFCDENGYPVPPLLPLPLTGQPVLAPLDPRHGWST